MTERNPLYLPVNELPIDVETMSIMTGNGVETVLDALELLAMELENHVSFLSSNVGQLAPYEDRVFQIHRPEPNTHQAFPAVYRDHSGDMKPSDASRLEWLMARREAGLRRARVKRVYAMAADGTLKMLDLTPGLKAKIVDADINKIFDGRDWFLTESAKTCIDDEHEAC